MDGPSKDGHLEDGYDRKHLANRNRPIHHHRVQPLLWQRSSKGTNLYFATSLVPSNSRIGWPSVQGRERNRLLRLSRRLDGVTQTAHKCRMMNTDKGLALGKILFSFVEWGKRYIAGTRTLKESAAVSKQGPGSAPKRADLKRSR
jgi:hypothetical protein